MDAIQALQVIAGAMLGTFLYAAMKTVWFGWRYARPDSGFNSAWPVAICVLLFILGFVVGRMT